MPPTSFNSHMRSFLFNVAITGISRVLLLRDRLLLRLGASRFNSTPDASVSRQPIPSGIHHLDSVFVSPVTQPAQAVLLICHGIGEIVDHWVPAQKLLAAHGVASLVFDYAGFGKSTGRFSAAQSEADTVAAFHHLQQLAPRASISLLGFSLGSGIAAAVVCQLPAQQLILGAAFTSFRDAAHSLGIPKFLGPGMPDLWHARQSLRDCELPVLVVHGAKDRLFPVRMAIELASHCGLRAELRIVPNLTHNQPFYRPDQAYWAPIASRLIGSPSADPGSTVQPATHSSRYTGTDKLNTLDSIDRENNV